MVYNIPIFAQSRHVIYRWKALELIFWDLKRGGALILGVRFYWGIYGILNKNVELFPEFFYGWYTLVYVKTKWGIPQKVEITHHRWIAFHLPGPHAKWFVYPMSQTLDFNFLIPSIFN